MIATSKVEFTGIDKFRVTWSLGEGILFFLSEAKIDIKLDDSNHDTIIIPGLDFVQEDIELPFNWSICSIEVELTGILFGESEPKIITDTFEFYRINIDNSKKPTCVINYDSNEITYNWKDYWVTTEELFFEIKVDNTVVIQSTKNFSYVLTTVRNHHDKVVEVTPFTENMFGSKWTFDPIHIYPLSPTNVRMRPGDITTSLEIAVQWDQIRDLGREYDYEISLSINNAIPFFITPIINNKNGAIPWFKHTLTSNYNSIIVIVRSKDSKNGLLGVFTPNISIHGVGSVRNLSGNNLSTGEQRIQWQAPSPYAGSNPLTYRIRWNDKTETTAALVFTFPLNDSRSTINFIIDAITPQGIIGLATSMSLAPVLGGFKTIPERHDFPNKVWITWDPPGFSNVQYIIKDPFYREEQGFPLAYIFINEWESGVLWGQGFLTIDVTAVNLSTNEQSQTVTSPRFYPVGAFSLSLTLNETTKRYTLSSSPALYEDSDSLTYTASYLGKEVILSSNREFEFSVEESRESFEIEVRAINKWGMYNFARITTVAVPLSIYNIRPVPEEHFGLNQLVLAWDDDNKSQTDYIIEMRNNLNDEYKYFTTIDIKKLSFTIPIGQWVLNPNHDPSDPMSIENIFINNLIQIRIMSASKFSSQIKSGAVESEVYYSIRPIENLSYTLLSDPKRYRLSWFPPLYVDNSVEVTYVIDWGGGNKASTTQTYFIFNEEFSKFTLNPRVQPFTQYGTFSEFKTIEMSFIISEISNLFLITPTPITSLNFIAFSFNLFDLFSPNIYRFDFETNFDNKGWFALSSTYSIAEYNKENNMSKMNGFFDIPEDTIRSFQFRIRLIDSELGVFGNWLTSNIIQTNFLSNPTAIFPLNVNLNTQVASGIASISWAASIHDSPIFYELEVSLNGGEYFRIYYGQNRSFSYSYNNWKVLRFRIRAVVDENQKSDWTFSDIFQFTGSIIKFYLGDGSSYNLTEEEVIKPNMKVDYFGKIFNLPLMDGSLPGSLRLRWQEANGKFWRPAEEVTPTVIWPTFNSSFNQTLATLSLPGNGSSNCTGRFEFTQPLSTFVGNAGVRHPPMRFIPDVNFFRTVTGNGTINVAKINPIVNWPTNLSTLSGRTLSQVGLPGNGSSSTPNAQPSGGSFSWVNPGQNVGAEPGSIPFQGRFTPNDTINFNTITGNINVNITVQTDFPFTGGPQSGSLAPGTYLLEVWGGSAGNNNRGGGHSAIGGRGAYVAGRITITEVSSVTISTGGRGLDVPVAFQGPVQNAGWPGGGNSPNSPLSGGGVHNSGGGGHSFIQINGNIVITAGGGGATPCVGPSQNLTAWTYVVPQYMGDPRPAPPMDGQAFLNQFPGWGGAGGECGRGAAYAGAAGGPSYWRHDVTIVSQVSGANSGNGQTKITRLY